MVQAALPGRAGDVQGGLRVPRFNVERQKQGLPEALDSHRGSVCVAIKREHIIADLPRLAACEAARRNQSARRSLGRVLPRRVYESAPEPDRDCYTPPSNRALALICTGHFSFLLPAAGLAYPTSDLSSWTELA